MPSYVVRTMSRGEIDIAVDWAAAEGWNPGLHDADCFHAADASGFLVGLLDGEPIATISVVKYGESFGFLGFYIVSPRHRGKGHGLAIWNAGLEYLKGRTIGLDGVVAQQDNYRKSGFAPAYRNIRYAGKAAGDRAPDGAVVPLSTRNFPDIEAYDRPFFPEGRRGFLECWIRQPGSTALGIEENGRLCGYGVIRPCRAGFKIGPLFADTPAHAEDLFDALQSRAPRDAPIYLDTPEPNREAVALAERHGMTPVFETARMYTGTAPQLPLQRLFGVTTFELG